MTVSLIHSRFQGIPTRMETRVLYGPTAQLPRPRLKFGIIENGALAPNLEEEHIEAVICGITNDLADIFRLGVVPSRDPNASGLNGKPVLGGGRGGRHYVRTPRKEKQDKKWFSSAGKG